MPAKGVRVGTCVCGAIIIVSSVEISRPGTLVCPEVLLPVLFCSVGNFVAGLTMALFTKENPHCGQKTALGVSSVLHLGHLVEERAVGGEDFGADEDCGCDPGFVDGSDDACSFCSFADCIVSKSRGKSGCVL